ncbi:MAG: hypothetical protein IPH44_15230 [Myxococcales bacterium]|nr:hypothetical protein [Myxococcales bacterium]MBK7193281.1 hypothetical protein [Myxococcales bacterium]MBP6842345.1 hypothetical protein [Kofleriaceae bacterium]
MRRLAWSDLRLLTAVAAAGGLAACGPSDDTSDCTGLVAGTLVVSEVQADFDAPTGSSGADTGHEWFEIYNASTAPVELAGVLVEHMRPSETVGKAHTMRTVTIPANGYLVLGNVVPEAAPAHVDYGYGADLGDLYNADGGKLKLSCGGVLIDEAIYDGVEPGHTRTLDGKQAPDYQTNDTQAAWCSAAEDPSAEYEPTNFGTPGAPNQECMNVVPGQCDDGGAMRATVPPAPGDLTITEVMPDPSAAADATAEWIEVRVNRDVDLNDLGVAGASGTPVVLSSQTCVRATAGTYLVFARSTDMAMNGGLPRVDGGVVSLTNTNGTVRLLMGATELDAMTWTSVRAGKSLQLSAGLTAPADNDVPANLCDGNAAYGAGDQGTPGAANRDCGGSMAGMCMDTGTGMMRPIVSPSAGQLVINEWMPNPMLVNDTDGEWFEVKALADVDLNGLQVGDATLVTTPAIAVSGPCVRVATGGYALFAQTTTPATNGMLPTVEAAFPTGVDLVQGSVASPGTLQIAVGGTVLSTVTWTASTVARAIMLDTDGTQCTAPGGVMLYNGTDTGTPRASNTPPECPP